MHPRCAHVFLFFLIGFFLFPAAESVAMNADESGSDMRTGAPTDSIAAVQATSGPVLRTDATETPKDLLQRSDVADHTARDNPQRPKSLLLPKMKICWFPLNRAYYS